MADKKKMSVAEILAAARKMDSAGGAEQAEPVESTAPAAATEQQPEASSEPAPAKPKPTPASKPAAKAPAGGGRPSVAEMLAMARDEKQAGAKESPKPAAKPATPKPAAATTPKPAAKAPASAKQPSAGPLDTASILAAARKADKPGPMSKAEAAKRKAVDGTPAPPVKKKIEAPPMPVKPAYAQRPAPAPRPTQSPRPAPSPRPTRAAAPAEPDRRGFLMTGWVGLGSVGALWLLATARFMYPNVLREPPSRFKVGFPGDFAPGTVETKFKAQFGVWVINTEYNGEPQLVALKSVCTHLGCTPNWLEAEQKFKCPCHGSGFYKDGINFEGPAPRPLERYAIRVADDGQVEIDKSRTFQEEMGAWADSASFIPV
jgi:cytochrome b6-f complex iron-sulfur subunit